VELQGEVASFADGNDLIGPVGWVEGIGRFSEGIDLGGFAGGGFGIGKPAGGTGAGVITDDNGSGFRGEAGGGSGCKVEEQAGRNQRRQELLDHGMHCSHWPAKAGGFQLETSARSEGEAVVETKKPSNPAKSRE